MRPAPSRQSAAASLWICQCRPVEVASYFCSRYMPTLRPPVRGSFVKTDGSVMKGPPSPGQQVGMGRRSRSGCSSTISWHGPFETVLARESASDLSLPSARILSPMPCGGWSSSTEATFSPSSSSRSTPKARHIRRSVPNWLIRSGSDEPRTLRKSSAGPPALTTRSAISLISRCGSTSAATSTSSPSRPSRSIHSRRSSQITSGRLDGRCRGCGGRHAVRRACASCASTTSRPATRAAAGRPSLSRRSARAARERPS